MTKLITSDYYMLNDRIKVTVKIYLQDDQAYPYVVKHPCFSKGFKDIFEALIELDRVIKSRGEK